MASWDHDDLRDRSDECTYCSGTGQPGGVKGGPELGACEYCSGSGRKLPRLVPRQTKQSDWIDGPTKRSEEAARKFPSDNVTDHSFFSGRVRRYHTWPTLKEQTVGDHCWGVYHTYWMIFGAPSAEVALYIHLHDADELVIGDNPFPMSARYPSLKAVKEEMGADAMVQLGLPPLELNDMDRVRVKVCDLLEMYQFGHQERQMGNLLATPVIERTKAAALALSKEKLSSEERMEVANWVMAQDGRHARILNKQGSTL